MTGPERPPLLGPVGTAVLAAAALAFALFELFMASVFGPGNSDEVVSGGAAVVPWFGLPWLAIVAAGVAVVRCRVPRIARPALAVAAGAEVAWLLLVSVI